MNMFTLLFVMFVVGCGIVSCSWWTWHSNYVGFLVGAGAAFSTMLLFQAFLRLMDLWMPCRPLCKKGKCASQKYKLVSTHGGETIFRCQCGDEYILRGRLFYTTEKGTSQLYMKRGLFTGWKKVAGS